jgi:hypothetical protein
VVDLYVVSVVVLRPHYVGPDLWFHFRSVEICTFLDCCFAAAAAVPLYRLAWDCLEVGSSLVLVDWTQTVWPEMAVNLLFSHSKLWCVGFYRVGGRPVCRLKNQSMMLVGLHTSFFAIRFRAFLWVRWIVLVLCSDMFHIVILWFRSL